MLKVTNLSKQFGNFALQKINFRVAKGEYFILLGPSGSGKTVLLEIMAGLTRPDSGTIELDGQNITHTPIQKRSIGLVFQSLELFPHLSVKQNITFPLQNKKMPKANINRKLAELAEKFGISHLLEQNAKSLSGGEQQRVALARTLATEPSILLLDEPISALDAEKRSEIRMLLRNLNRKGQTIIHVTHDFEEAIGLARSVGVMGNGRMEQMGTPSEIFNNPESPFVARLVGVTNFFPALLAPSSNPEVVNAQVNKSVSFQLAGQMAGAGFIHFSENAAFLSRQPINTGEPNTFKGTIVELYPHRLGYELIVDIGIMIITHAAPNVLQELQLAIGKTVWVSFDTHSIHFVPESPKANG